MNTTQKTEYKKRLFEQNRAGLFVDSLTGGIICPEFEAIETNRAYLLNAYRSMKPSIESQRVNALMNGKKLSLGGF